jgi:hypothetical protein
MTLRKSFAVSFSIAAAVVLSSCKSSHTEESSGTQLAVHLLLPKSLARGSPGYDSLTKRASHLLFRLKSKEGFELERAFPVEKWEALTLDGLSFPQSERDRLEITAEVWLPSSGEAGVAALRGKSHFSAADLNSVGEGSVEIKLHALLPISELRGGSDLAQ